jgi:hypothetical protein
MIRRQRMVGAETQLPVDEFNANLRDLGRDLRNADLAQEWRGDEFGLAATWPDGMSAWISYGPIASAMVEARFVAALH